MKDDKLYLIHIIECIERIDEYTADGRESFMSSALIQDAVLRNLQTMGQSVKNLSDNIKTAHPDVDWREIIAFRNVLVHGYLGIDVKQIWEIIEKDLPVFEDIIKEIMASME